MIAVGQPDQAIQASGHFAGHDHVVSYMWDDNFDTAFFISGAGSFSCGCMKSLEAIFRLHQ